MSRPVEPPGQNKKVDIDPDPCNALTNTDDGLLAPKVRLEVEPGLKLTPPDEDACPQVWRIGVDAAWTQTPATLAFRHDLTGGARAWEIITEVPTLTIPRSGVWEVNYQVRGGASLPGDPAPPAVSTGVTAGMHKNGAHVPGTEALVIYFNTLVGDEGHHAQASASRQFMHGFAAGDRIQLAAFRITTAGEAQVFSNRDGRTYLTAHWVAPPGDTNV
jgi:hypothetical protein